VSAWSSLFRQERGTEREPGPPCSPPVFRYFPPPVAKLRFRSHNDDRPSKFIVLADDMHRRYQHGLGTWGLISNRDLTSPYELLPLLRSPSFSAIYRAGKGRRTHSGPLSRPASGAQSPPRVPLREPLPAGRHFFRGRRLRKRYRNGRCTRILTKPFSACAALVLLFARASPSLCFA
jgi:hypothetical protein